MITSSVKFFNTFSNVLKEQLPICIHFYVGPDNYVRIFPVSRPQKVSFNTRHSATLRYIAIRNYPVFVQRSSEVVGICNRRNCDQTIIGSKCITVTFEDLVTFRDKLMTTSLPVRQFAGRHDNDGLSCIT